VSITNSSAAAIVTLGPTAGDLGTTFTTLGDLVATYALARLNKVTVRAVIGGFGSTTGGLTTPWVIAFIPFGGNAPANSGASESLKSSKLMPPYSFGSGTLLTQGEASLTLTGDDLTVDEVAEGPGGGPWIPTNSLGTQTNWGKIYWLAPSACANITTQLWWQIEVDISFADIYDPINLFKFHRLMSPPPSLEEEKEVASLVSTAAAAPTPPSAWSDSPADLSRLQEMIATMRMKQGVRTQPSS